jgi:hypothetical protein
MDTAHRGRRCYIPRISGVISSSRKPVSAKQNLFPPRPRGFVVVCHLLGFFLVCFLLPRNARADSLEESARALARKVWSSIHATSVTCHFRNLSSLRRVDFANLSAAFEEELKRRGIKILPGDAAVNLIVSVTQDPADYIGVVQIQRKENTETVMETLRPVDGAAAPEPAFSLTLHREFLFSQTSPIVDAVVNQKDRRIVALGTQEVYYYELRGGQWMLTSTDPLPVHGNRRELRGFLEFGIDVERAELPGDICTTSISVSAGWNCTSRPESWWVRAVSTESVAGKITGPWISAAQFETDGKTKIVVTGEDGLARLYEDTSEPVAVFPNWGSEIASVYSGCGSGWQLLVTGRADWTQPDEIQAIDIEERRAQPVSDPLEFSGPIVALHNLWTRSAENTAANAQAVAIVRNLQTGWYEAYLLSIACSR